MLKAVDDSYVVNTERPFSAQPPASAVEILLRRPWPTVSAHRAVAPVPLPEQDWLLAGRRVDQVVCGRMAPQHASSRRTRAGSALQRCYPTSRGATHSRSARTGGKDSRRLKSSVPAGCRSTVDAAFIAVCP